MGLNWSEGLAGASQGLARMGEVAFRREMQEAEAARAENLERLRQANQLERDKQNFDQAKELEGMRAARDDARQDRADERADERIKAADARAEALEKGRDGRLAARERAADGRLDTRLAYEQERYLRGQNELRLTKVREDERAATSDLMRLQAEYAKAKKTADAAGIASTPQQQAEARGELARLVALMEEARTRQLQSREEVKQWNQRVRPDIARQMREDTAGAPPPRLPATDVGLIPVPRESRSRFADAIGAPAPDEPLIPRP